VRSYLVPSNSDRRIRRQAGYHGTILSLQIGRKNRIHRVGSSNCTSSNCSLLVAQSPHISLEYSFEFLYIVELCPYNTRFLWYTGSIHIHLQTICMQTKYKPTASIVYVRSVAIANATNTTITTPLLFLLSAQFLILYFGFKVRLGGGGCPL
jgi:hypothetical protein